MITLVVLWSLVAVAVAQSLWSLKMSKELEDLRAAVENNGTVTQSAIALIDGIADRLDAALKKAQDESDDAPLEELSLAIRAQSKALSDAVAANTTGGGANPQSGATSSVGGPGDSPVAS